MGLLGETEDDKTRVVDSHTPRFSRNKTVRGVERLRKDFGATQRQLSLTRHDLTRNKLQEVKKDNERAPAVGFAASSSVVKLY